MPHFLATYRVEHSTRHHLDYQSSALPAYLLSIPITWLREVLAIGNSLRFTVNRRGNTCNLNYFSPPILIRASLPFAAELLEAQKPFNPLTRVRQERVEKADKSFKV